MRKFTTLFALLIVAVFAAKADTIYAFGFASASAVGGYHGGGVFDVNGSGVINALTGTLYVGSSLTGEAMALLPPGPTSGGPPGFAGNDNVFTDTSPYFSILGFAFTVGSSRKRYLFGS